MDNDPLLQTLHTNVEEIWQNSDHFNLSEEEIANKYPPYQFRENALQQIANHKAFIDETRIAELELKQQIQLLQEMAMNDSRVLSEVLARDCRDTVIDVYSRSYAFIQPFIEKVTTAGNIFATRFQKLRAIVDLLNSFVDSTPSLQERRRVFSFICNSSDKVETVASITRKLRCLYEQNQVKVDQYEKKTREIIKMRQRLRAITEVEYQCELKRQNSVCCPNCKTVISKEVKNCPVCGKMVE